MIKLKKGDVLIAIDPCTMEAPGENCLTVGKEYPVNNITETSLFIIDDENDPHEFPLEEYSEFFVLKTEVYNIEIYAIKKELINAIMALPESISSKVIDMQERTIYDDGHKYQFIIREKELVDISINDTVSMSELSIEDLLYLLETWQSKDDKEKD